MTVYAYVFIKSWIYENDSIAALTPCRIIITTTDEKRLQTKSVCGRKILGFKNSRFFVQELVRKMSFFVEVDEKRCFS